jgi:polar amino acid transport system permease protein
MEDFLQAFLNWEIMREASPILWAGLRATLLLSLLVVPLGLLGGIILAVLSTLPSPFIKWPLRIWVDTFRALPPLVLLIFIFAGLPFLGLEISAWSAVAIGFFLNTGAYYGEILRAGIESVPRGQVEAARSTGLTAAQTMRFIVLPQAIRRILPALGNQFVYVLKMSSLVSVIGLQELPRRANELNVTEYRPLEIYTALVFEYLLLILLTSWGVRRLERRMAAAPR